MRCDKCKRIATGNPGRLLHDTHKTLCLCAHSAWIGKKVRWMCVRGLRLAMFGSRYCVGDGPGLKRKLLEERVKATASVDGTSCEHYRLMLHDKSKYTPMRKQNEEEKYVQTCKHACVNDKLGATGILSSPTGLQKRF
jgi:hypothetical protein